MAKTSMGDFHRVTDAARKAAVPEPWRVGHGQRDRLLTWFQDADLASAMSVDTLKALTGRSALAFGGGAWLRGARWFWAKDDEALRMITDVIDDARERGERVVVGHVSAIHPGVEKGRHMIKGPSSRQRFVTFYRDVQRRLWSAQKDHADEMKGPSIRRMGAGFVTLSRFTDDIRIDAPYREARSTTGRATWSVLDLPGTPDFRTLTLVGELTLAMFLRLLHAKSSVICPYCERIALFDDPRKRVFCGRDVCRARYGHEWRRKNPEDGDVVAVRMRRMRKLRKKEKKSG